MRRLLVLGPLVLALAACGGGGKSSSGSGSPLLDAANATTKAGSENTITAAKVFLPGAPTLTLNGDGGYNHTTDEGYQHVVVKSPIAPDIQLDQIFVKNVLWMKSPLFANSLPSGKSWLEVDVNKAGKNLGTNYKALMGQTPADVLKQLQRAVTTPTTVGTETIGGVETTHYRAAIDTRKIPAADTFQKLTKAVYKPIDVWVDADGLVRQARFDYTALIDPAQAARAHVVLTMKLSDFGATVDVEPPPAKTVVDASAPAGSG